MGWHSACRASLWACSGSNTVATGGHTFVGPSHALPRPLMVPLSHPTFSTRQATVPWAYSTGGIHTHTPTHTRAPFLVLAVMLLGSTLCEINSSSYCAVEGGRGRTPAWASSGSGEGRGHSPAGEDVPGASRGRPGARPSEAWHPAGVRLAPRRVTSTTRAHVRTHALTYRTDPCARAAHSLLLRRCCKGWSGGRRRARASG